MADRASYAARTMPALTPARIAELLTPYLARTGSGEVPPKLFEQLTTYLDLLLQWNAHTNLTAIRDPEAIVTRHFGESLVLARLVPANVRTLLDLGSGAGFPGVPIQLLRPELQVTLAESQGKKASFLREVVRSLSLPTHVHAGRAERLRDLRFDAVAMRAVDDMKEAVRLALDLGDVLLLLTTPDLLASFDLEVWEEVRIPHRRDGVAVRCVPRGTSPK